MGFFEDLSTVVDGNSTNDVSMKPFTARTFFTLEMIPIMVNCIKGKKVWHELAKPFSQDKIALPNLFLILSAELIKKVCIMLEFLMEGIPAVAQHDVNSEVVENDQVKKLVETKSAFSAGAGLWNICGTRIGNARVVTRAQAEQLLAHEAVRCWRESVLVKAPTLNLMTRITYCRTAEAPVLLCTLIVCALMRNKCEGNCVNDDLHMVLSSHVFQQNNNAAPLLLDDLSIAAHGSGVIATMAVL